MFKSISFSEELSINSDLTQHAYISVLNIYKL